MSYDWDFSVLRTYWPALMGGLWVTIQLSGLAIIVGTLFGFALGLVMRIRFPLLRWPLIVIVDIVRSIPPFVLLLIGNYLLPDVLHLPDLSPFAIASVVLILNLSCFVGDVVRGAFSHVPQGEIDAARAVGLTHVRVFTRFVLPRVVRLILPTLTLLYIATIKNSALASVIAVYDLAHVASLISTVTYRTLEAFLAMTALYVALILPLTLLARRLEVFLNRSAVGIGE
jgi:polar amino acid transport system permease protein